MTRRDHFLEAHAQLMSGGIITFVFGAFGDVNDVVVVEKLVKELVKKLMNSNDGLQVLVRLVVNMEMRVVFSIMIQQFKLVLNVSLVRGGWSYTSWGVLTTFVEWQTRHGMWQMSITVRITGIQESIQ